MSTLISPIKTIDQLLSEAEKFKGKRIFVLFSGTPLPDGTNWCPDCVKGEPIIKKALEKLPENAVFLKVEVGDRNTWRDPENVFRTHPKCRITSIPSLIEFNTMKRLSDSEVLKPGLVELMFED
uniref:Thioredoxin domain-containing protein 17 n=1 Tax=Trichobilharzia regenti TaxID=157069 RepID=A0AA85IXT0_TRIRE|nr:unnamed protein product [Trichobilharzia regenti]